MEKYTIKSQSTIKEALQKLSICGEKCLVVIDNKNKLLGTISDGDIRKSIINHKSLSAKISNIYNKKPKKFFLNNIDEEMIENYFIKLRLEIIPVVTKQNKLADIILFSKYFKKNQLKIKEKFPTKLDVIIMAGGFGTRLAPFSNIIPKPLMPYKNSTLIETIMDQFKSYDLNNFTISLNYKEQLIRTYLKSNKNKYKIKFVNETFPMGTIGSLSKIKKPTKDFFIINCDTIIDINYLDVYEFHKKNKFDITIISCSKEFKIPYGCFDINNKGKMIKMIEKPKQNYLVNTGLYLINSKILKKIPKNKKIDFNEFLEKINDLKFKIGFFAIDENSWKDFGEISSFNEKN